jgi:hypothetical protein
MLREQKKRKRDGRSWPHTLRSLRLIPHLVDHLEERLACCACPWPDEAQDDGRLGDNKVSTKWSVGVKEEQKCTKLGDEKQRSIRDSGSELSLNKVVGKWDARRPARAHKQQR